MNVYEFIEEIKKMVLYKVKMSMYVETINIYVCNEKVYKLMLHVNPDVLKRAKKVGLNQEYVIYDLSDKGMKIKMDDKFKQGYYIIIWDLSKNVTQVYEGENSEMNQFNYIKKLVNSCNS